MGRDLVQGGGDAALQERDVKVLLCLPEKLHLEPAWGYVN